MRGWRTVLNGDPTEWLLKGDPSLRYRVLTELLDVPAGSGEAIEAREALMTEGPVAKILSSQQAGGHWGREEDFYVRSKYKGTVWNLILLAQLGADPRDERIARAADFCLRWSRRGDGGFTYTGTPDGGSSLSLPCLSGNMAWSLAKLGSAQDPRLGTVRCHLSDLAQGMTTEGVYKKCWRCRPGLVKVLKALLELNSGNAAGDETAIDALATTIARRCLPGGEERPRPEWYELGFPLMWNTDLVEILDVLSAAGSRDERMREALDGILARQDGEGRWTMERCFQGRHLVSFGSLRKPSRWTTFRVISMLKNLPEGSKA